MDASHDRRDDGGVQGGIGLPADEALRAETPDVSHNHNDATPVCFTCLIKAGEDVTTFSQVVGKSCARCGKTKCKALYQSCQSNQAAGDAVKHEDPVGELLEGIIKHGIDDETMQALRCLEVETSEDDLMAIGFKTTKILPALDSGAGEHVCGPDDIAGFEIKESAGSKAGKHFLAANGDRIANLGEVPLTMRSKDGAKFGSTFQVADVTRPLYSVGRMCDAGCTVSFTKDAAVVKKGEQTMVTFKRSGGLYIADLEIVDNTTDDGGGTALFQRQGAHR